MISSKLSERDDLTHIIYRTDIVMLDPLGNRLKTKTFDSAASRNTVPDPRKNSGPDFSIVTRYTFKDPDPDSATMITVKREGQEWKVLTIEDIETKVNAWRESLDRQNEIIRIEQGIQSLKKPKTKKK